MAVIKKTGLSVVLSALMIIGVAYKAQANPDLTAEELIKAKGLFFNRCAGCHGTLRKGATGPNITDAKLKEKNYDTNIIKAFITNGTGGGMPTWGEYLSADDIDLLARFLQNPPPAPPEMSLAEMKESWRLIVPEAQRPKKPEHSRNYQNFFGIVLRDAGKVAIIDGDTKEIVNVVDTGFAVHILRTSASGRYFYSIGRDGKATMIDLWMKTPDKVAEVKTCFDARSIDSSKYNGKKGNFLDKLAIVGCYWPPHFVVLDGQTLEPKKVVSTRSYSYDTNEYIPEARVAAIISAHKEPEWIINVKEAGYIWAIDYSDLKNLKITQIETERFLHDGGWDASKRYIMMAANMKNKMVIVDSETKKQIAQIETGQKPHPGRGANWTDPEFGPVSATPHLGEGLVAVYGSDPKGHPKNAWKVVRKIETLGGGGLFVKTHPKAEHVWVDHTLNPDDKIKRSVCAFEKNHPNEKPKCFQVADHGRVVHLEYNKTGTEVWVAVWDKAGEIIIFDDKTLKEKSRIKADWLVTPTGHFNVYNTMTDTY
ncbi:MAG: c-type cytochrome [Deltaproteobacteria bacterium]|nr:c-type cytochrome [Deltaproteobacteria bacterium]